MRKAWNDKDDAKLTDMWSREIVGAEIAYRLGCSESAVYSRARTLGLAARKQRTPRTHALRVKLSKPEHEFLTRLAHLRRRTIAGLVRDALLRNVGPQYRDVVATAAKAKRIGGKSAAKETRHETRQ